MDTKKATLMQLIIASLGAEGRTAILDVTY